jgi:hypothetical protein
MHLEYDINGRGSSNILNKDSLLDFDGNYGFENQ